MQWTRETPTVQGWYWLRYEGEQYMTPIIHYLLPFAGDLWLVRSGHPMRVDEVVMDARAGGNPLVWAGPIPEPEV